MKFKLFIAGFLVFFTMVTVPSVSASNMHEKAVYGTLPHKGLSYVRYPVYDNQYAGTQEWHDYPASYYKHKVKAYLDDPYYHPRHGWVAQERYARTSHNYRRPTLYPGLYKFHRI